LRSYARYHNEIRADRSLDKDAPVTRPVQRVGIISSRAVWADFIIATPAFKLSVRTADSKPMLSIQRCTRRAYWRIDM
jgi:hypothetical protein